MATTADMRLKETEAVGELLYDMAARISTSRRGSNEPAEVGAVMGALAQVYAAQILRDGR